MKDISFL